MRLAARGSLQNSDCQPEPRRAKNKLGSKYENVAINRTPQEQSPQAHHHRLSLKIRADPTGEPHLQVRRVASESAYGDTQYVVQYVLDAPCVETVCYLREQLYSYDLNPLYLDN